MDSPRDGYHIQHTDDHPAGWTAVNRPPHSPSRSVESPSPRGTVAMQTTIPAMPVVKPVTYPFKAPVANAPRTLLPRPQTVLKSHQPSPKPCLVCTNSHCALLSHKRYAEQILEKRRARVQPPLSKGKTPVRPPQAPPRPPEQFVQYPIAMDSERHQLLSLWSQDWSLVQRGPERHLFPFRWIDKVLPTAMSHAPLFQALLATSASMWAIARHTLGEATTRHLQFADQILSQTCTTHAIAATDECLLAALLITFVHQAQGNIHETDKHFSHIVNLVHHERKGPCYLGMSGVVADMLSYIDYLQAAQLDCEPAFAMTLPALDVGIVARLGAGFRELLPANIFSVDLLLAAGSLCRTTDIFEQPQDTFTTSSGALNAFSYLSSISEYQLVHCNAVFHASWTWNECICLALLLFNHIVLRNDGAMTAPIRKLERQFWQTIDNTVTRHGYRDIPPCVLLWMYITGLSSSIWDESQYRLRAIKNLRAAKISAAITGWDNFQRKVLDDFVWLRSSQEKIFREIWTEVEGYTAAS